MQLVQIICNVCKSYAIYVAYAACVNRMLFMQVV